MTEPTAALRAYLPWLRQGLVAALPQPDDGSAGLAVAHVPLRLWINDAAHSDRSRSVPVPVALSGPGEVTALSPAQVVRTFPGHLSGGAQPGMFPIVEFDRADLPWLFTPRRATPGQRLRPWLVLVVVTAADSSLGRAPGGDLPVLDCPSAQLPDLAQSWAWAHAQVVRPDDSISLRQTVTSAPERSVSRLVCPRRLLPGTAYRACVVPAFATGRQQGLGAAPAPDAALTPAWPLPGDGARVRLPVYYYWEFTTGDTGDFEALARLLRYQQLPASVGAGPMQIATPGWGVPDQPPRILDTPAALRVPSQSPRPWPDDERAAYAAALQAAISPGQDSAEIRPPVYGGLPAQSSQAGAGAPTWLTELNSHPGHRAAAGLGAFVVKMQQEQLVSQAWAQLPPDLAATRRTRAEVAAEVSSSIIARHLEPLPALSYLQVTSPSVRGGPDGALRAPAPVGASVSAAAPAGVAAVAPTRAAVPAASASRAVPQHSAAYRRMARFAKPALPRSTSAADARLRQARATQLAGPPGLATPRAAPVAATADTLASEPAPRFAPRYPQPGFALLRDYCPDQLLPGAADVPVNSVSLLSPDAAFIESFLVGMNDELARELAWRNYPADPRATFFAQFWTSGEAGADIPDIRSWSPDSSLGSHLTATGGLLVLMLRGELLRSYPRTRVEAVEAVWNGEARAPGTNLEPPLFRVRWGSDITLTGFALPVEVARGSTDTAQHPGWWFVVSEPPEDARFGLDAPTAYGGKPATWDDLSWGHLVDTEAELAALSHVSLPGRLGGVALDGLPWGSDAAAMAVITEQRPFRVAIHASAWLPPEQKPEEP